MEKAWKDQQQSNNKKTDRSFGVTIKNDDIIKVSMTSQH